MITEQSPYFILNAEFVVPQQAHTFSSTIDYYDREEAKDMGTKILQDTPTFSEEFDDFSDAKQMRRKSLEEMNPQDFDETFSGFLDYMKRDRAKNEGEKLAITQIQQLEKEAQKDSTFYEKLMRMKQDSTKAIHPKNNPQQLQTGLFTMIKNDLSMEEKMEYASQFNQAQENQNVMFRQVFSFSTKGLIEAGIYNPYNNELQREPLIEATRQAMKTFYQKEKLDDSVMTLGEIHYNTQHFHIHVASLEKESNRPLMEVRNEDGSIQMERRGTIKPESIQAMKSQFVNYIFDRTHELESIGNLRNELRQEVKTALHEPMKPYLKQRRLVKDLIQHLPDDRADWNSKQLSPENRQRMNRLIDTLMQDHPKFKEYQQLARQENQFKSKTYGKLPEGQQSFYEGRMNDIYYRLGNSILQEFRTNETYQRLHPTFKKNSSFDSVPSMTKTMLNRGNSIYFQMKKLEKATQKDFKAQQMEWERERMEQEVERAKQQSEFEL